MLTAAVEAYKRKEAVGGGFRGVAVLRKDGQLVEKIETDVYGTQQDAWVEICRLVWLCGKVVAVAHRRSNRYRKDYTIEENET